ncbi:probable G-protein coupled receptor 139 [Chiloscyllium plagiosum]|uniref:probable G-protein coupled receptor 139 n=1 Tax=Chiloscyllium plagiosum TaxID=36176 RepID=UPI001CB88534|nr:probable G-protein coupled receptor 139 [Chiloscyllium plagiosum]
MHLDLCIYVPAANLIAIVILSRRRCGLSSCITRYLLSMAVTDLLVVIIAVILHRIRGIYFPVSFLTTTPGCSASAALNYAARDSSVWLTVAFTFDRCVAICCQKLKVKYCTEKTAAVVIATVCSLSCMRHIPTYFIYEPVYVIDNVPWFCSIKLSFYASPGWAAFDWMDRILTPCVPFILILLLNTLTIRHVLVASKARKRLQPNCNGANQRDPEMENRKKSMIFLLSISGSFVALWMAYVINMFYVRFTKGSYFEASNITDPRFILQESGYMLQLFSCCTNTCIYAATQSKFRKELNNAVKYPFKLICKFWE